MSEATIGAPAAIASSSTIPNDSPPVAGDAKTVAVRKSWAFSASVTRPEELDALEAAGRHVAPRLALLRPRADDQQPRPVAGLAQDPVGLEQVEEALARLVPADEQDVRRAVLPAGERDGVGEARRRRRRWG